MTLKEELEILRGEPIQVCTGDPMDIPCIETSDPEKLCKHPVVSVNMITYNHEPYIRQAIEGVMMQKTDFEFELVIGEDASTDKTREICFEYQKRYPDKIRVLWWHENLRKVNHPGGGNGARTRAHCRGEFIALCEGDDYWIDPLKLQKQVDVMRKYPNVGFIFCDANVLIQDTGEVSRWDVNGDVFKAGCIRGRDFLLLHLFGRDPSRAPGREGFIMTAGVLYRKKVLDLAKSRYDVFSYRLALGDKVLFMGLASCADAYYLREITTVYRIQRGGAMHTKTNEVLRDSALVRLYYSIVALELKAEEIPFRVYGGCFLFARRIVRLRGGKAFSRYMRGFLRGDRLRRVMIRFPLYPFWIFGLLGALTPRIEYYCQKWLEHLADQRPSNRLKKEYSDINA